MEWLISVETRSQLISRSDSNAVNLITSAQALFRNTNTECGRKRSTIKVTHMAIDSMDDIKVAIQRLTVQERRTLESWLIASFSYVTDVLGDHVAEPAVAYGASEERPRLSVEEYLAFEEKSEQRHEYIDGVIYAMCGASQRHELVAGNLFAAIHGHLRGGPCKAYMANFKLRLRIDQKDLLYYPDVMVACGPVAGTSHYLQDPKLVVEVLSPSTASIDRREKFLSYKQIATVEEYVLVAQDTAQITTYRREQKWAPRVHIGPDSIVSFQSIGFSLGLEQIYEGVV
jgi:Uma2 family endonuclease